MVEILHIEESDMRRALTKGVQKSGDVFRYIGESKTDKEG